MARKKQEPTSNQLKVTDKKGFTVVYNTFLESDLLDYYEKIIFISIKKFADGSSDVLQAFPSLNRLHRMTGISKSKIQNIIASLESKGVLRVEHHTTKEKGHMSNIYTLIDSYDMWKRAGTDEELKQEIDRYDLEQAIKIVNASGKFEVKEKEPDNSEPTKVTEVPSTQLNQFDIVNTTLNSDKSQVERYTIDQIRQFYDYDILIHDNPYSRSDIDSVMDILHTSLNTTKPTIRISGEDKPTMVVIGKLMNLTYSGIMYAIEKYKEQTERITNPRAYILTILYHAEEQMNLDIANQVSHDMANWNPPTE